VVLGACSDSSQPDASSLAALSCNDLGAAAELWVKDLDASCTTVDDCVLVGYDSRSCLGTPELLALGGAALSKNGAAIPNFQLIVQEFQRRCSNAPCSDTNSCRADVAPKQVVCTNRVCIGTERSCPLRYDAPRQDAPFCAAGAVACGDRTCAATEYCTLNWPGIPSSIPDGGSCPGWCLYAQQVNGCACPEVACRPLPTGCHACDCLGAPGDCAGPSWVCVCPAGGGLVANCYRP
jgi:hypothetical protein